MSMDKRKVGEAAHIKEAVNRSSFVLSYNWHELR
jgi:hypothetical protein